MLAAPRGEGQAVPARRHRFAMLVLASGLRRKLPWYPFLEKEFDRPHARIAAKATHEDLVVQRVADCSKYHPLVVRHVAAHQGEGAIHRHPLRGEVGGLEATVSADMPEPSSSGRFRTAAPGSTASASADAYGATTRSRESPRLRPSSGHAEGVIPVMVIRVPARQ